jgi:hypothetical protein
MLVPAASATSVNLGAILAGEFVMRPYRIANPLTICMSDTRQVSAYSLWSWRVTSILLIVLVGATIASTKPALFTFG